MNVRATTPNSLSYGLVPYLRRVFFWDADVMNIRTGLVDRLSSFSALPNSHSAVSTPARPARDTEPALQRASTSRQVSAARQRRWSTAHSSPLAMCYSGGRRSDPAAPSAVSHGQRGGAGFATADTALSAADEVGTARRAHPSASWQHHFRAKSLVVWACPHASTPPTSDPVPSMDGASPAPPPLPPPLPAGIAPPATPNPYCLVTATATAHVVRWANTATRAPPRRRRGRGWRRPHPRPPRHSQRPPRTLCRERGRVEGGPGGSAGRGESAATHPLPTVLPTAAAASSVAPASVAVGRWGSAAAAGRGGGAQAAGAGPQSRAPRPPRKRATATAAGGAVAAAAARWWSERPRSPEPPCKEGGDATAASPPPPTPPAPATVAPRATLHAAAASPPAPPPPPRGPTEQHTLLRLLPPAPQPQHWPRWLLGAAAAAATPPPPWHRRCPRSRLHATGGRSGRSKTNPEAGSEHAALPLGAPPLDPPTRGWRQQRRRSRRRRRGPLPVAHSATHLPPGDARCYSWTQSRWRTRAAAPPPRPLRPTRCSVRSPRRSLPRRRPGRRAWRAGSTAPRQTGHGTIVAFVSNIVK